MHAAADCEEDLCVAPGFAAHSALSTFIALSPFIVTFLAAFIVVQQRIFPQLSRVQNSRDGEDHYLPSDAPLALQQAHAEHGTKSVRRRIAAITFATTVALATVLGELILCEISDLVDPYARGVALRFTVPTLLFLLVVLIPFLELQSIISGSGWSFQRTSKGRLPRVAWMIQFGLFGLWLFGFWSLGSLVPLQSEIMKSGTSKAMASGSSDSSNGLARACLERIGVIGISLMALLSGFASVSSPWHAFGSRASRRPVTEADVARKQAGLDATNEMLVTKRHRLRQLQRKAAENPAASNSGFLSKVVGNIRGGGDAAEMRSLKMEIVGLEAMESNLAASLATLRARQVNTARARTTVGKLFLLPTYVFSIYCLYRIAATLLTTLRRLYYPASSFSSSDPINRLLGLLAKHWDPKLDQIAWARQISFLLSGVILAASANSVLQTFHLFARWTPGLLYQAQANLALLIGQISAIYVISAALLLRSNLPKEMGSAIGDALESALEPGFVDRWFEGWFLLASVLTAAGIWVGRKLGEMGEDWDDIGMEEMGQKRS
ncbi:Abscisic acid G-protein coupled receptor-domain-containing protein [Microdochium trichocladiopsis]|uniref:Abscisic acid G-protein coupled receptor-domain-containing protein n=1 Tax=Microdochium trichocladiopsis TaxID=1682393 RepID=A0A9P8YF93_9PEZI|nr:Abscisic acid G-protein coupled receptor-domain-containing protein [Microdochium trichocladiopsis]KAH7037911.1 Abscisic acid G-protein coupled receptor-domain-containing protein [Microdochium trichocladiopsis]